jgi:hypothetical protein
LITTVQYELIRLKPADASRIGSCMKELFTESSGAFLVVHGNHPISVSHAKIGSASLQPLSASNSLINLGDLGKPATVLIERVSDAVGGVFKPWQIIRVAEAQAQADKISAVSQIEVSELQRRSIQRMLVEEARKQQNIEEITAGSLPLLMESADPASVESDWISNFFENCRLISDEEMQNLWSRVLAGEANTPGTYSKRTINFLGGMDKHDASVFASLCRFSLCGYSMPLIYDIKAPIYAQAGITYGVLQHLDDIGLATLRATSSFHLTNQPKVVGMYVYGKLYNINLPLEEGNQFCIGHVLLSKIGKELARLCPNSPVEGFEEYLLAEWRRRGYQVSEVMANGNSQDA